MDRPPVSSRARRGGAARQTRRELLAGGGRVALASALGPALIARAAEPPVLRVAQWAHFVPAFDQWFDQTFASRWGERHGVRVEVEHLSPGELRARATSEVATGRGHDLFGFTDPPAGYEGHVVPLTDVVAECERRFGRLVPLAHRGTFNPRSRQYFALAESWAPAPIHYRTDWWGEAGLLPDSWDRVREGARRIRERRGATAGFGLAPEPDSNMTLRGLLWTFGAAEQDEAGQVAINSRATVEAVKLMAALYRESMTSDVFVWDPSSNNRVFVWGRASVIENAISALRTMETHNPELAARAALAPPPAGPRARIGSAHLLHCYVIWKSSPRSELAKRFLVDLVAASEAALRASELYNLPCFPGAVPELARKLGSGARTSARYTLLAEAERWSTWAGHPGHATPAIEETLHRSIIPVMFARAARGELAAEEAVRQAEVEMRRIFARWSR
jgi:multiple sugar transport system substrate-binding protein